MSSLHYRSSRILTLPFFAFQFLLFKIFLFHFIFISIQISTLPIDAKQAKNTFFASKRKKFRFRFVLFFFEAKTNGAPYSHHHRARYLNIREQWMPVSNRFWLVRKWEVLIGRWRRKYKSCWCQHYPPSTRIP